LTTKYDTFERANGIDATTWVGISYMLYISGGYAGRAGAWYAYDPTATGGGRHDATMHLLYGSGGGANVGVFVKVTPSIANGYSLSLGTYEATPTLYLRSSYLVTGGVLASVVLPANPGPYVTLRIVWDTGHISCYVNGVSQIEIDDVVSAGGLYMGLGSNAGGYYIADFLSTTDAVPTLSISPLVIGNYGACTDVTLTGSGTAWTPGTPGAPTFTVNHGTISAQTVNSATSATLTYCPGDFLGTATFTDPSTGQTVAVPVTSDPAIVPPSGVFLSQTAIDYIERSAVAQASPTILNQDATNTVQGLQLDVLGTYGKLRLLLGTSTYTLSDESETDMATQVIWDILTHRGPAGADVSFRDVLAQILTNTDDLDLRWQVGETIGRWKVDEVLNILGGITHKSHVDILDAIAEIEGGSNQDVLDALAAVRGDEASTIKAIQDHLAALRTDQTYTLSDVKGWIDALPQTEEGPTALALLAVIAALALAIPTGGVSIAAEAVAIGAGPMGILAILFEVAQLIGTIAGIATDIALIKGALSPSQAGGPPVWPGLDNVALGTPVDLATGLTINEPMDGVLVSITGVDQYKTWYTYDTRRAYRHIGALAFLADNGAVEQYQVVAFTSGVYTPLHLERAAGVVIRTAAGTTGTATPWSRS
jgi:hypothetical protein